jgi:RING finger and CHY zinc finger domain-containing protein 1
MLDMKELWEFLDEEVENTPMPEEYENMKVDILCRDCHATSYVKFHVAGLKCSSCNGYNTTRTVPQNHSDLAEKQENL